MVDLIPDRPEIPALPATDSRMTHDEGQRTSQRLALKLAYDGTDFAGWQRQPGERTVQGELERIFGALAGLGMFGGLMGIDEKVVQALSPIANVPALPTDDWIPTVVVSGVAVVAALLALVTFRRRDLST